MEHDTSESKMIETKWCNVCIRDVETSATSACSACKQTVCDDDRLEWIRGRLKSHALRRRSFVFMSTPTALTIYTCPFCRHSEHAERLVKRTGYATLPNGNQAIYCQFLWRGREVAVAVMPEGKRLEIVSIGSTPHSPTSAEFTVVSGVSTTVVLSSELSGRPWVPVVQWCAGKAGLADEPPPPQDVAPPSAKRRCVGLAGKADQDAPPSADASRPQDVAFENWLDENPSIPWPPTHGVFERWVHETGYLPAGDIVRFWTSYSTRVGTFSVILEDGRRART